MLVKVDYKPSLVHRGHERGHDMGPWTLSSHLIHCCGKRSGRGRKGERKRKGKRKRKTGREVETQRHRERQRGREEVRRHTADNVFDLLFSGRNFLIM